MELTRPDINLKFAMPMWRQLVSFWSWWSGVLLDMLPGEVRRKLLPGVTRLYLDMEGEEVVASIGTAESHQEVVRYSPGGGKRETGKKDSEAVRYRIRQATEVVLCLPRDQVLTKQVTLPLAAEENLREVLGFEMDRETPFTAAQVYYDGIVLERRPKESTLILQLILTPRKVLDDLLVRLAELGFHPLQVTNRDADGNPVSANLIPPGERSRNTDKTKYLNIGLGMVLLLLLITAISLPLLHKSKVIHTLESAIDMTTGQADLASKLRDKVDQLGKGTRFLVDKKQSTPLIVETIAELTRILPDDTWVTRLEINGHEVQVQGQSASAAALIPLLESSSELHNARFRSPVTQTPHAKTQERFHLSVETQPGDGS
jgi:general secretion pathway protein L